MDQKKLKRLYNDVIALQHELEVAVDNAPHYARELTIKALAAAYELQDYLAFSIEDDRL